MKKLNITAKMDLAEQRTRMTVNRVIEKCGNPDRLKNWLLDQVTGVEMNGVYLVFPNTMTYEQALGYFEEATM